MAILIGAQRLVIPDVMDGTYSIIVERVPHKDLLQFVTSNASGGEDIVLDRAGVELLSRELLAWLHLWPK